MSSNNKQLNIDARGLGKVAVLMGVRRRSGKSR